ncbi:MAG: 5-(carboxyamino)imidazole ribonucleotide mutase [Cenarchaeum symbiont of Oopsacas minuta]|nr:5-(carboxyamino)imidazole ribonucleotide mutase [Cenarchaeum symbiont of Oopsacas minuta]
MKMSYKKSPLVGIVMGSSSDARIMVKVAEILDEFSIKHEDQIVSAHRTPTKLEEYAKHAKQSKFRVIIAGAGGAAHLPGMIASYADMPVIGVPILVYNDKQGKDHKFSAFGGIDSLVSISEMPTGSPVACVGINKATNAGLYAVKILANEFSDIATKLVKFKVNRRDAVLEESKKMRKQGLRKFSN